MLLRDGGIETVESCQGGEGHSYHDPTVRFVGGPYTGFKALSLAMMYGLPVYNLSRTWKMIDGEPTGPEWLLTFTGQVPIESYEKVISHFSHALSASL